LAIISAQGLTKKFGEVTALAGVDLDIHAGELFGLLGPNGAGKTTLISILATMVPATTGTACVCGHDVNREEHAVRRSIGIVFQDPSLDDELTGEENLDFHGRLYGLDADTRKNRIQDVLTLVDLQDRRHDLVRTYSGGMRRRLEIARGLMHRPRVLFLDEPTLGLDPQTRRKIWDYIEGLKDSFGMTIILTTHYMDEADRLCSRIAIIDRGEIVALDSPKALKERLGGDLLEIEVSSLKAGFIDRLKALEDVIHLSIVDNVVSLTVPRGESFIPHCFDIAQGLAVDITSVALRKPNLEDVFIQLTGRDIREEEAVEPEDRIRIYLRGRRR
jgi:ABC-2 type transport system ATP-binding protein